MTASLAVRERLVLDRLRETYEQKGYEFFVEPSGDLLPPFLHGYRPDAIALKAGEGVVIEVKFGNHPQRDRRLESLAVLLEGQTGWRLKIYGEQPRPEDDLSISAPTSAEIDEWIAESERLTDTGHTRAAFLLAWSILEAIARARTSGDGQPLLRPVSPEGVVQSLEMNGDIDSQTGQSLRQLLHLRNRIAHGDLAVALDQGSVDSLIHALRDLASADHRVGSAHARH
jgi:hypothetical protein